MNQTFFRLLPALRGEKTKPSALGMSDPVCGLGWLGWSSRSILVHQRLTWISRPSNLCSNQAAVGVALAGRAAELHGCVRGSAARVSLALVGSEPELPRVRRGDHPLHCCTHDHVMPHHRSYSCRIDVSPSCSGPFGRQCLDRPGNCLYIPQGGPIPQKSGGGRK